MRSAWVKQQGSIFKKERKKRKSAPGPFSSAPPCSKSSGLGRPVPTGTEIVVPWNAVGREVQIPITKSGFCQNHWGDGD